MNASVTPAPRPGIVWLATGLAVGLLTASLIGPTLGTARAQDEEEPTRSISVTGTGRVFAAPDVADVVLGVVVQEDTAKEASAEAAAAMDAVVAALLAAGIAVQDIQTTQLTLNPVYDWDDDPPQIEGWEATNIVSVVVRDVETVGDVIDAAIEAGATSVQGITFRIDDPTAAQAEARSAAVADAKAKADQLAADAGVNITGVLTITEQTTSVPPPIYLERAAADAAGVGTPVLEGQVETTVNVFIVYTIE